jgi:hypothetical protein
MQEGATTERVPSAIQITVRWGASVLMAKRISPPKSMPLTGGVGRLELGANGLELVAGRERVKVVRGKRTKLVVDDVEIVIDATEDQLALVAFAPAFEKRFAASDAGSFVLHAGALALGFLWHTPLSHAETDVAALQSLIDHAPERPALVVSAEAPSQLDAGLDGQHLVAAGPQSSSTPAAAPRRAAPMPASPSTPGLTSLDEARSWGMIGLLATAAPAEQSPWTDGLGGPGLGESAMWGTPDAAGLGSSGLGLSGIGEGGGRGGLGIALGMFGTCGDDCGSGISGAFAGGATTGFGHMLRGRHVTTRAPRFCGGPGPCGAKVEGRLPPEVIQRIVRQNHGRFRQCYVDTFPGEAKPTTRVSVGFVIGRDGSVTNVSTRSDGEGRIAPCVARAFYALSFPQPEGGVVVVTYPLVFTTDG